MVDELNVNAGTDGEELTLLKKRADLMGMSYHPKIGVKTLKEKINAELRSTVVEPEPVEETQAARFQRIRQKSMQLVRVQLTMMNPMKRNWNGDFYEVSNKAIGTIREYVPFNANEKGWHIPRALLNVLKSKTYQSFYTVKGTGKKLIKRGKQVSEFGITELPNLTKKELAVLAQEQATARNID